MDVLKVIRKIDQEARSNPTIEVLRDYAAMVREGTKDEKICKKAVDYGIELSDMIEKLIKRADRKDEKRIKDLYMLHEQVFYILAPYDFDSYCMYIEWDREPKSKFYAPRRKQLRPLANALQDLYEGKLNLLCISMPPGTGKSGLALFFLTWWGAHIPNRSILTVSHNFVFVKAAYEEIKKIIGKDSEYRYSDVFPTATIQSTDALGLSIALDRTARFPTFSFGSVGSNLAGRVRAESLMFCDDLIPSIEVALSEEQLDKVWTSYTSDLLQRKIGSGDNATRELHIATRWSVRDVIGRLKMRYEGDLKAKFIEVPAMDDMGRSRFDYPYGLGYSTTALRRLQADMDEATWGALYMCKPIERDGQLYASEELQRYFELPDKEPDAVLAICDTKNKGEDYEFMPVGYVYGDQVYIEACVCNDGKPEVVEPMCAELLVKHKVQMARFESNNAGDRIAQNVQKLVKDRGGICKITTKYTTANKETKIIVNSEYVKQHFLFKDNSVIGTDREYRRMMQFLTSYTLKGKNKHDDVPDGMAMFALYVQSLVHKNVEVFTRPF